MEPSSHVVQPMQRVVVWLASYNTSPVQCSTARRLCRICHSDVCEQPMHKSLQEPKEDNMLQEVYIPKECNHAFVLLDNSMFLTAIPCN